MPDAFFANSKKRKRATSSSGAPPKRPKASTSQPKSKRRDEELSTSGSDGGDIGDMDLRADEIDEHASGEEDLDETVAEKRLRLAKLYLDGVKNDLAEGEFDAADLDRDIIMSRLQQDVLQHSNKVHVFIAEKLRLSDKQLVARGHRLSLTGAAATEDGRFLYTCGKEGDIIQHDLQNGKRKTIHTKHVPKKHGKGKGKGKQGNANPEGHSDELWAIAVSSDGKYLASGGKDRRIGVWDLQKGSWIKGFTGHKDSISGLSFRKGSHQLYSASHDRSIKLHDLSILGYVETLFGHQDKISAIDALRGETALSCGGRDKTVRYWKVAEETQVVFRGGAKSVLRDVLEGALDADGDGVDMEIDAVGKNVKAKGKQKFVEGSMECVAMIDESTFISGGDSGTISLWNTAKKKPIFNYQLAHGLSEHISETEGKVMTPRWITALAALPYSDFFVSGSWDGHIRLWRIDPKLKSFEPMDDAVSIPGIVNSLQVVQVPKRTLAHAEWYTEEANGTSSNATNGVPNGIAGKDSSKVVLVVAAIGQEPRTGRWLTVREGAKNCALVVPLHVGS